MCGTALFRGGCPHSPVLNLIFVPGLVLGQIIMVNDSPKLLEGEGEMIASPYHETNEISQVKWCRLAFGDVLVVVTFGGLIHVRFPPPLDMCPPVHCSGCAPVLPRFHPLLLPPSSPVQIYDSNVQKLMYFHTIKGGDNTIVRGVATDGVSRVFVGSSLALSLPPPCPHCLHCVRVCVCVVCLQVPPMAACGCWM